MARKKHVDAVPVEDSEREVDPPERTTERTWQAALRPQSFDEYIGQKELVENLRVSVHAAKQGGWPLDHFLFAGPPGLGKTTLAHVIANELGASTLHAPASRARRSITRASSRRCSPTSAKATRCSSTRSIGSIPWSRRTSIRRWKTSASICSSARARTPRRSRCSCRGSRCSARPRGWACSRRRCSIGLASTGSSAITTSPDMKAIVLRSARLIGVAIDEDGAQEIARRARGTPRIANRLLRRVRDFASVERDGTIDGDIAASSLDRLAVDHAGLDMLDRAYLTVICERFDGGPVPSASRPSPRRSPKSAAPQLRRGRRAVPVAGRLHRAHAARSRRHRGRVPAHGPRRTEQGADGRPGRRAGPAVLAAVRVQPLHASGASWHWPRAPPANPRCDQRVETTRARSGAELA